MWVQIILIRLDSKRALGRNYIINGVNVNIHQNASLIFVWSLCGPAFRAINFHEYRLRSLVGFIFGACIYP